MDIQSLADRIAQDARNDADTLLSEAKARIANLQAASDHAIEQMQRDARERAAAAGDALEQNLRRLSALEGRKGLLAMKRQLMDEGFDLALERLHSLPAEKLRQLFMQQLTRHAKGDETVYPGAISPAFFDPGFLEEANQRLLKEGKPGRLQAADSSWPGVCGLVLEKQGTSTHLTTQAMMALQRPGMERDVAQFLCEDLT